MATIIIPCDCTEAMREAYHEIARREGKPLGQLIAQIMKERYPELDIIVEQVVEAGGPKEFRLKYYGTQWLRARTTR
jgi:hypothetical protein